MQELKKMTKELTGNKIMWSYLISKNNVDFPP